MEARVVIDGKAESTAHDTSTVLHDRSALTYPSSYTDYGIRRPNYALDTSYVDPASRSYASYSMPAVRIVEVDPGEQMFPSHPKASLILSIILTFVCCFACSIPAIVYSKQALDYQMEGEKRLAARLSNQIAFWLVLSIVGGLLCWSGMAILIYAYRFY